MPREARQRREQGMHHVVVQGKRKEQIFGEEESKERYLETVLRYKQKTGVQVYAYCILENHAHLVLRESAVEDVSNFMRRVGVSYAYWYRMQHPNHPAGRELFRGRYMSEPLETEPELLETVRYIHQEPLRLHLAERMEDYPWSSYRLYLRPGSFIDSRVVLDSLHFSGGYASYMQEEAEGSFLEEVPVKYGRDDAEARELLEARLQAEGCHSLLYLDDEEKKEILRKLRYEDGISIQQLARVSGVNRGIIQRLK